MCISSQLLTMLFWTSLLRVEIFWFFTSLSCTFLLVLFSLRIPLFDYFSFFVSSLIWLSVISLAFYLFFGTCFKLLKFLKKLLWTQWEHIADVFFDFILLHKCYIRFRINWYLTDSICCFLHIPLLLVFWFFKSLLSDIRTLLLSDPLT